MNIPAPSFSLSLPSAIGLSVVGVTALAHLWYRCRRRGDDNDREVHHKTKDVWTRPNGQVFGRRISKVSCNTLAGGMPEWTNFPESIIHGMALFAELPSREDVIAMALQLMQQNERCGGVPVAFPGNVWRIRQFSPAEMKEKAPRVVRQVEIHCSRREELYDELCQHLCDPICKGRFADKSDGDQDNDHNDDDEKDTDLPWWEILLLKNNGPGLSAAVLRIHHGLGDGLSLASLLTQVATTSGGKRPLTMDDILPRSMSSSMEQGPSLHKTVTPSLEHRWSSLEEDTTKRAGIGTWLYYFYRGFSLPISKFDDRIYFLRGQTQKMLHTRRRQLIVFPPVPIDFIKSLKTACQVSFNDVVVAALSQAIHDYCLYDKNDEVLRKKGSKTKCRMLLPTSLPRPPHERHDRTLTLRNKWLMMSVDIGVGFDNMWDRVRFIQQEMQKDVKNRHSPFPKVMNLVQDVLQPALPLGIRRETVYDTFIRHSLLLSTVPGPTGPIYLAGRKVEALVHCFNNLINHVDVLTYNGQVGVNFLVDTHVLEGSSTALPKYFHRALVELANRVKVEVPPQVAEAASAAGGAETGAGGEAGVAG